MTSKSPPLVREIDVCNEDRNGVGLGCDVAVVGEKVGVLSRCQALLEVLYCTYKLISGSLSHGHTLAARDVGTLLMDELDGLS